MTVEDKGAEQLDCAIKLIARYHENPEGAADAFSAGGADAGAGVQPAGGRERCV